MAKFKGYPPNRETWGIFKAKDASDAVKKGKNHSKKLKGARSKDLGTDWKAVKTKSQSLKELKTQYHYILK